MLLWKNTGRPCVAVNLLTRPIDDIKAEQKKTFESGFCGSCCECNSLKSGLLGSSTNHLATIGPFHNEHVQTRMTLHFLGCMCLQLLQLSGFVTVEPGEEWGPCGGWKRGLSGEACLSVSGG